MQWYRNLENKLESLNLILKNKKVKLNSVVSFCLPLYTLTILFSLFLLTKQKYDFLANYAVTPSPLGRDIRRKNVSFLLIFDIYFDNIHKT